MRASYPALLVITAGLLVWGGCKKDDTPRVDLGLDYFPTATNGWIDYAVDSSWLDEANHRGDTIQYALREELTNDFTDPEGRRAQRVLRSVQDSAGNWVPRDVWWQVRTNTQAERSEENMRRIKLIFPPRTGQYWNTNAPNTSDELELTYLQVDVPWSVNGLSFDSTVLVKTTYPNNLVFTRTYYERYAKHVGLVYREVDSTETQLGNTKGTWYKQVITAYSH